MAGEWQTGDWRMVVKVEAAWVDERCWVTTGALGNPNGCCMGLFGTAKEAIAVTKNLFAWFVVLMPVNCGFDNSCIVVPRPSFLGQIHAIATLGRQFNLDKDSPLHHENKQIIESS